MPTPLRREQREQIIALKRMGYKVSQINKCTGISRKCIYFWLRRWEESGELETRRRRNYDRATTKEQDAAMIAAHMADPYKSTSSTSLDYNISVDTVRRRLKAAGLKLTMEAVTDEDESTIKPGSSADDEPSIATTSLKSQPKVANVKKHAPPKLTNAKKRLPPVLDKVKKHAPPKSDASTCAPPKSDASTYAPPKSDDAGTHVPPESDAYAAKEHVQQELDDEMHAQSVLDDLLETHGDGIAKKRKVEPVDESSEASDASLDGLEGPEGGAGAGAGALCCCCLAAAGGAALAAAPADTLAYCFDINYPLELRAASSICRECVAKLHDGVQFKRRALECLSILTDYRETDGTQADGSLKLDSTETYNIVCEEDDSVILKQEPLMGHEGPDVPIVITATPSQLDKIQQEYDLSTGNDELLSPADHEPVDANQHMNTPIFTETPVTEDYIKSEIIPKLTPEDIKFFQDGCKCEKNCYKRFTKYEILAFRRECEKYRTVECNTNHLDIFLTGALACITRRDSYKHQVKLKFRNVTVCKEFFMYIFALNQQQFNNILRKIENRTIINQWLIKSISDQPFAIKFLKDYSTQHSLVLPGRFSNKHPDLHILPRNVTKTTVYSEYAKACVTMKKKCINQITWDRLWERLCPYIVRKVPSDLCVVCRDNNARAAAGAAPAVWQQQLRHLQLARDAAALRRRALGGAGAGGALQCGVDWLQPLRLRAGGAALLAVARPPPHGAVVYVAPQRVAGGCQPANLLLSLLHHFLQAGAAQWHCGPRLRAERVLQYAAWRGRAARTALAFLPRGHDAAPLAPAAALLAVALRHRPAGTIRELCQVLASTGNVTPIAVATELGDLNVVPIYDWLSYFDARNPNPVSNIQNYCHFEANSDNVGTIKCKVSVTSEDTDYKTIFASGVLTGGPELLKPAGLTLPRLGKREFVVEYCPNEAKDPLGFVKEELEIELEEDVGLDISNDVI